jgi:hypothetical protein
MIARNEATSKEGRKETKKKGEIKERWKKQTKNY